MKHTIYTDGACKGNPGPGGWAFLVLNEAEEIIHESSGGESATTTNNRMEMLAVIEGLKHFNGSPGSVIEIKSDSAYVVNCMNQGWISGWIRKGWINSAKKPVINKDLWQEMSSLVEKHNCTFTHVKGHSTNPFNNRVDELASGKSAQAFLKP